MSDVPSTSKSNQQNGNTPIRQRVFILSPDVLKRLGIADKLIRDNAKVSSQSSSSLSDVKIDNTKKKQSIDKASACSSTKKKCQNNSDTSTPVTPNKTELLDTIKTNQIGKITPTVLVNDQKNFSKPAILKRKSVESREKPSEINEPMTLISGTRKFPLKRNLTPQTIKVKAKSQNTTNECDATTEALCDEKMESDNTDVIVKSQNNSSIKPKSPPLKLTTSQIKYQSRVLKLSSLESRSVAPCDNNIKTDSIIVSNLPKNKDEILNAIFNDDDDKVQDEHSELINENKSNISAGITQELRRSRKTYESEDELYDPIFSDCCDLATTDHDNLDDDINSILIEPTINSTTIELDTESTFGKLNVKTYKGKSSVKSSAKNLNEIKSAAKKIQQNCVSPTIKSASPEKVSSSDQRDMESRTKLNENLKKLEEAPVVKTRGKKTPPITRKKRARDSIEEKVLSRQSDETNQPVEKIPPVIRTSRRLSKPKIFQDCIQFELPSRRISSEKKDDVKPVNKRRSRKTSIKPPLTTQTTVAHENNLDEPLQKLVNTAEETTIQVETTVEVSLNDTTIMEKSLEKLVNTVDAEEDMAIQVETTDKVSLNGTTMEKSSEKLVNTVDAEEETTIQVETTDDLSLNDTTMEKSLQKLVNTVDVEEETIIQVETINEVSINDTTQVEMQETTEMEQSNIVEIDDLIISVQNDSETVDENQQSVSKTVEDDELPACELKSTDTENYYPVYSEPSPESPSILEVSQSNESPAVQLNDIEQAPSPQDISPASASPIPYVEPQSPISTEDTPPVSPPSNEPEAMIVDDDLPEIPSSPVLPEQFESISVRDDSPSNSSAAVALHDEPASSSRDERYCTSPTTEPQNNSHLIEDTPPVSPPSSILCTEPPSTLLEENNSEISPTPEPPDEGSNLPDNTPPVSEASLSPLKLDDPKEDKDLKNNIVTVDFQQTTEVTSTSPAQTPTPKRRGRPRKTPITDSEVSIKQETEIPINILEQESTPRIKRVPIKLEEESGKISDESSEVDEDDSALVKRGRSSRRRRGRGRGRGRGRTKTLDSDDEYVPRSGREAKKMIKEETDEDSPQSDKPITCGKCREQFPRKRWSTHNLNKHNNTAWKDGEPEPDYLNDEKLWKRVLKSAHMRKRILICDKCEDTRRSIDGFVSHYRMCGKTDDEREAAKWVCPLCRAVLMPSSRDYHERWHRDAERNNVIFLGRTINSEDRGKRKAAEKAEKKISEFTALVKDGDEPPLKKSKKVAGKMNDLIEHPRQTKLIPSVWKGAWSRAIDCGRKAFCRQPGCTFETDELEEIYEHHGTCNFTPSTEYVCKACKYLSASLDEMEKHVKNSHSQLIGTEEDSDFDASNSDSDSDDNNFEYEERSTKNNRVPFERVNKSSDKVEFLRKEPKQSNGLVHMTFAPALRWTMEFEQQHYKFCLFPDLKPNIMELLSNNEAKNYLPQLKESMRTQRTTSMINSAAKAEKNPWKIWRQFESAVDDDISTFFVGGPIWALAWLPIPVTKYTNKPNQYLAISTHNVMEGTYAVGQSYKFKNIIQLWNLGHLDHSSAIPNAPELAYAIAHDKGTVWCMEWCPSGAYENSHTRNDVKINETSRRMGLLATACSDGCVHIYSLPFPEDLQFIKTVKCKLPIYKVNPVMSLHVNNLLHDEGADNWQCVKLSWSKVSNHDTIAAGFSNGFVGIWDIASESPLLMIKKYDTIHVNSIQHFYAHSQAVTFIQIVPLPGRRFLATASLDRYIKYWDLENTAYTLMTCKKGAAVNGAWMTHWPNVLVTFDDFLSLAHTITYLFGFRDPPQRTYSMLPTNSTAYGVAVSDYSNGICQGTLAGEIAAIFPYQLLCLKELDKLSKKRWLLSSIEVIDFEKNSKVNTDKRRKETKDKEYVYQPETYEKCRERFGIVFHDNLDNFKPRGPKKGRRPYLSSDAMSFVPVEQYHFASVNRIAWNSNAWSYLWIASGYQNGLIRILHFKSMSMQNAVKKMLSEHAVKMLAKETEFKSPVT